MSTLWTVWNDADVIGDRQLDSSDFVLNQSIVEIRYPKTHTYWDRSGKLIETIEARIPGLQVQDAKEAGGFKFAGEDLGISAAIFFWDKTVVVQGANDPASKFGAIAQEFWRLTAQALEIGAPTRLGHRMWFLLKTQTQAEAVGWLRRRQVWGFYNHELAGVWGLPVSDSIVLRTKSETAERDFRIEIGAATVRLASDAKAEPGVMWDIDVTASEPVKTAMDIAEFVRWNYRFVKQNRGPFFEGRDGE